MKGTTGASATVGAPTRAGETLREALKTGVCLVEVHYGPQTGQTFIMCGICPGMLRVDNRPGGPIMQLAGHILKHRDEEEVTKR